MYRFKLNIPAQEIAKELKNGQDVVYQGSGSVESQIIKDQHNGEYTITSIIKPYLVEIRPSNERLEAPVFKGEVKHKSLSQKVRDKLWILHQKLGLKADFETFYEEKMTKYLDFLDQKLSDLDMEDL
jgi:hypothetical protein